MEFSHYSVLLEETISNLCIKPDGVYVDATSGGGGHSLEIVKRLSDKGLLIAIDRDKEANIATAKRLSGYENRFKTVNADFGSAAQVLKELGIKADGIIADLGVSSYQLDNPERGFSYTSDAPLDMRMDQNAPLKAYDIVNTYSRDELKRIFYDYGEERYAPLIAAAIVREREKSPINSTGQLAEIIKRAMPSKAKKENQHPAKRCFQAIRIEVNGELSEIQKLCDSLPDMLRSGARACIISFHSLEDRIVKKSFAALSQGCTCPKDFPICVCGNKEKARIITKKPILPGEKELSENSRSRSAKLRVCEII